MADTVLHDAGIVDVQDDVLIGPAAGVTRDITAPGIYAGKSERRLRSLP